MTYQNLSYADLAIASLLILINGVLSVLLKLQLERQLLWAALRTVVQLLAIDRRVTDAERAMTIGVAMNDLIGSNGCEALRGGSVLDRGGASRRATTEGE